nr:hypothetical protein [Nostoc sp. EkiNYC01]
MDIRRKSYLRSRHVLQRSASFIISQQNHKNCSICDWHLHNGNGQ